MIPANALTKKQRILLLLMDGREHTNSELSGIAIEFRRPLKELRGSGLDIETICIDHASGLYAYRLHTPADEIDEAACRRVVAHHSIRLDLVAGERAVLLPAPPRPLKFELVPEEAIS
jgi:hypothetical protein